MQSTRFSVFAITLSAGVSIAGCSGTPSVSQASAVDANSVAGSVGSPDGTGLGGGGALGFAGSVAQGGSVVLDVTEDLAGAPGVVEVPPSDPYPKTLPPGFTPANMFGGYLVGEEVTADSGTPAETPDSSQGCGTTILAVIRDFKADGQNFEGPGLGDDRGMVLPTLGPDRKPVFAPTGPTPTVKNPEQFANWYRTVEGVNQAFKLELWFGPNNGVSSFQSTEFFPLDGKGLGEEMNGHNYHFTTEIHTRFKYEGGESFKFTGDDDVWVFINERLAIDLGGVHMAQDAAIDIDARANELGLEKGKVYAFDMFQNERHTIQSNFRADTNLNFVDCGTIVPEPPVIPK